MRFETLVLLLLAACSGDTGDDTTDTDGDTGTAGDTDTTPACTALTEGHWSMSGSCFGMAMDATMTLRGDGCRFEFSEWNMGMSVPEGGKVEDGDVTLTGAGWDDCTGTTDGTSISGSCGDGCTYEMAFDG